MTDGAHHRNAEHSRPGLAERADSGAPTSEGDAQNAPTPDVDPRRNDQAAPTEQETRPSADEDAPVSANDQTGLSAEQQPPPSGQAAKGGPARDQIVDAQQPDASLAPRAACPPMRPSTGQRAGPGRS